MTISERLDAAMKAARFESQSALSRASGVPQPTINRILKGVGSKEPQTATLKKLAAALNVGFQWLNEGIGEIGRTQSWDKNIAPVNSGYRPIPLINYVQAGVWTDVIDAFEPGQADEYLMTDLDLSGSAFALQIKGDSMLPEFKEGDRVIIDPDVAPSPGDCVVAKNGSQEATFKKYRPRTMDEHGNVIFELVPLNEDYPTLRSDVTRITIVGTMVEHRKYRKR